MDVIDAVLVVILVIIVAVVCLLLGDSIGRSVSYNDICVASGYDGYEEINDVHYCYTQNSDGAEFVEVLVCGE